MPIYDFSCACGAYFEALLSRAADPAPGCPDCGAVTSRRPAAGAALMGKARLPAGPDSAPGSWNGTFQGDRDYVTHWRRTLDERARLEEKHPELAADRSPVMAHEGPYEGAPLTAAEARLTGGARRRPTPLGHAHPHPHPHPRPAGPPASPGPAA